ncbi:MAG: PAS domain S-box protein, partial [Chloroflexi bacterium]|nr:PAS domain S-box protein [Chloroflexota bacterium]
MSRAKLYDSTIMGTPNEAVDFISNILESSTQYSIIGKDLDGRIVLWNEGARLLYGYGPDEVIGKANSEILHTKEDIASGKPRMMMEEALRSGKWEGTLARVRKNGSRFTARVVITPRRDSTGKPIGFVLMSKDITEEVRLAEELKATQFYTRSQLFDKTIVGTAQEAVDFITNILESSTEYSVIGKDLDGKIVLWNEGARLLYGYAPEEVVGKANSEILHSKEDIAAGRPRELLDQALADGKWEGTLVRVRKNGNRFTARVVITPRRDANGKAIGFLLISKDITEEIRLTEELKATQLYTRSLIESNIDALMTTDPVGVITDVNRQMEQLTGCSRQELIGSPFKQYFTDPQRAEEGIKLVLHEGKVTNYELTARAKNGRTTVVSYNASTFRDSKAKLQGVFAAAREITEQKRLESQLRESQSYNRGLIEASVDGLITVDPSGTITDVNEQMCRMSAFPRDELIGSQFADYFIDADRATAGVRETLEKGVVKDYVLTLRTRDVRSIKVSFNASVFRDPGGSIKGIFASARDITDQAQLQSELAAERTYNRGLIEASVDGLITVDPLLEITDVNETMCRMSGYTRNELVQSSFQQYFTDPRRAAEGVRLTLDQGSVTNYELVLRSKDRRERKVSFNAAVFKDQTGVIRGIFASARDVTEQARLQEQLADERAYNRGLIEASVDGLVTVDENMNITDVNDTMCRLVGRPRNQVISTQFPRYFTEPSKAEEGVRLTFKQGAVTNYVLNLEAAEGRQIPVSFNAAVFKDTQGAVRGIFASARDITSQQQLEVQLQASQTYTRSLIESNIDALMTTDSLGRITDVNKQMETLTGHSRQELIGSLFKNYFTEPDKAEEGIRLVLREGRVTNYELTASAKSGRQTVVSYNAVTFIDENGKLQGVFAGARDITEHKRLEEQLREQQIYLRGLIESSADGLITVDPKGTITDINDRMCQMTGYTRAELIGTPFADYFTEPAMATRGIMQTLEKGVVTEYALTLIARSRRLLQVSFNASVFKDPSGGTRGIFASARDVTDRFRLEEQQREQQTYLRGLIESSVDGLITVDPEGFITDVNEQMCRMTGYERNELVGSPFKWYFTEPDRADLGVKRTLADGVVTNYQLVLKSKGGRKATVSFNASVFRGPEKRAQGIFASARDISEQSRLQTQLSEQEAYNRSLIEASADALFAIAPDGVITDVNEEATRLTGHSRKYLISSPFATYFTDPDNARSGVQQAMTERRVIGYELILVTRHGRRIVVSLNAGVFTNAAGSPMGILAAARDIGAQKLLENQIRDQQAYTRSLIEANIDALMTTDPVGVISDVNKQMESLTGYSRTELIGSPFKGYFTEPPKAEEG